MENVSHADVRNPLFLFVTERICVSPANAKRRSGKAEPLSQYENDMSPACYAHQKNVSMYGSHRFDQLLQRVKMILLVERVKAYPSGSFPEGRLLFFFNLTRQGSGKMEWVGSRSE